jgi:hypothetical protein
MLGRFSAPVQSEHVPWIVSGHYISWGQLMILDFSIRMKRRVRPNWSQPASLHHTKIPSGFAHFHYRNYAQNQKHNVSRFVRVGNYRRIAWRESASLFEIG